jgi:DNA-binding MarR family transcriptional regulator
MNIIEQKLIRWSKMNTTKEIPTSFLHSIAKIGLTRNEYRVLIFLMGHDEERQAQIGRELSIPRQNINKAISNLKKLHLVEQTKVEGKNIFFKVNLNFVISMEFDKIN